jgi:isocitrate dehydrogenase (NAD+)
MTYQATLIPGDGIGPEITAETVKVLTATGIQFEWDEQVAGVTAVERTGTPIPDATLDSIRQRRLALKGPLTTPVGTGFRSVNVALRKEFQLYANLRPAYTILPGRYDNIDIVLVRENLEGLYSGVEHFIQIDGDPRAVAVSEAILTRQGAERILRFAFEYAVRNGRRKVTIVHKANILKMVGGLFLDVGHAVGKEYEGRVSAVDMIVDNAAMQLVLKPEQFDVIVTTNLFGDILSDARGQYRVRGSDLRGGPRQCTGHRRPGPRQPVGPHAGGGDDARPSRGARSRRSPASGDPRHDRRGRHSHPGPGRYRLHPPVW